MNSQWPLFQALFDGKSSGRRPVVLTPSYAASVRVKKLLAYNALGFRVQVCTLSQWLVDSWELYGDGRKIVDSTQRLALCAKAWEGLESGSHPHGPDSIVFLASLVSEAMSTLRVWRSLESDQNVPSRWSAEERAFLEAAEVYQTLLDERFMIEACEISSLLNPTDFVKRAIICYQFVPGTLTVKDERFLESLNAEFLWDGVDESSFEGHPERSVELQSLLTRLYQPDPSKPLQPEGSLRFAFATGQSAEYRLVHDLIENALMDPALTEESSTHRLVVVADEPFKLFNRLAQEWNDSADGSCALLAFEGRVPLIETQAARALLQLAQIMDGQVPPDTFAASDFAINPLNAISRSDAFYLDGLWRSNRLTDADTVLSDLAQREPDALQATIGLFETGELSDALRVFKSYWLYQGLSKASSVAFIDIELRALDALEALAQESEAVGLDFISFVQLLSGRSIQGSLALVRGMEAGGDLGDQKLDGQKLEGKKLEGKKLGAKKLDGQKLPVVEIRDLEGASDLDPCSCDILLMLAMNASQRPIRADYSAKDTLLNKLGIPLEQDPLLSCRLRYRHGLAAARSQIVLERRLTCDDAEPEYPASLFEETVDCYRADLTDVSNLVQPFGITSTLMPWVTLRSEEDFLYNITGFKEQACDLRVPQPLTGIIDDESRSLISLPQKVEASTLPGMSLSASQIESYLECPYQWFVVRRLRLQEPDEKFGAIERGNFVHSVLCDFYNQWMALGNGSIDREHTDQALELLNQVFDDVLGEQAGKRYLSGRLIPINGWEWAQVEDIRKSLRQYISEQPAFLPAFRPRHMEWAFGEDIPVYYGDNRVVGKVDRIDVDDANHAVIIDYKTGNLKSYVFGKASQEDRFLPRKIQALIYAQMVSRQLGYDVVGTLYVNPLTQNSTGVYEPMPGLIYPEVLPSVQDKARELPRELWVDFKELLNWTEHEITERLESLAEGNIAPCPYDAEVCRYCPAILCEKRLS